MTQENKEILLKDLCARLPYGVKCNALLKQIDGSLKSTFGTFKGYNNGYATVGQNLVDIETVRPYLRPMSSMTGEEEKEYYQKFGKGNETYAPHDLIDWLNAHYFDYRNLIECGLAVEVTEDNNPYKE